MRDWIHEVPRSAWLMFVGVDMVNVWGCNWNGSATPKQIGTGHLNTKLLKVCYGSGLCLLNFILCSTIWYTACTLFRSLLCKCVSNKNRKTLNGNWKSEPNLLNQTWCCTSKEALCGRFLFSILSTSLCVVYLNTLTLL